MAKVEVEKLSENLLTTSRGSVATRFTTAQMWRRHGQNWAVSGACHQPLRISPFVHRSAWKENSANFAQRRRSEKIAPAGNSKPRQEHGHMAYVHAALRP